MPVYIIREGASFVFKIGRTKGEATEVLKRLQTGNSQRLSVFDTVETNRESACESFFHRRLQSRRVGGGGGWEFFRMDSCEEMHRMIHMFRAMLQELDEAEEKLSSFERQHCSEDILDASEDDRKLLERLLRNKEEQAYLKFECELLESQLKLRIGGNAGICGVATWKTELRFDETLFERDAPEAYADVLRRYPCIDTTAWKKTSSAEYNAWRKTFFTAARRFLPQKMG